MGINDAGDVVGIYSSSVGFSGAISILEARFKAAMAQIIPTLPRLPDAS